MGANKRASQHFGVPAEEADKVDEAFAEMNITKFVQLLASKSKLSGGQIDDIPPHPWAVRPASVCALCAMQLAVLATSSDTRVSEIVRAGAVPKLAALLDPRSPEDQVHAAVVALVLLSSGHSRCCEEI